MIDDFGFLYSQIGEEYSRFEGVSRVDQQPVWCRCTFQPLGEWEEISFNTAMRVIDKFIEEALKEEGK